MLQFRRVDDLDPPSRNISLHPELSDRYTLITVNRAREKWGQDVEFSLVIEFGYFTADYYLVSKAKNY